VADLRPHRRRHLVVLAVGVLCAAVLASTIWIDVDAHTRTRNEEATLVAANVHLAELRHQSAATLQTKGATTTKLNELKAFITVTLGQLSTTNTALDSAQVSAYLQGIDINALETCLGGIQNALSAIRGNNNDLAAQDISAVSGACSQLEGGISSGLVYPFDFPDPDVMRVGSTYYAYATNSVSGNIQIIESSDLTHWSAVGNALPHLPSWASADYTWAPSVALIGGTYDLYYAVDPTGSPDECISVATSSSPVGPFVDASAAPLECQPALGGAIDPDAFVDTNSTAYLLWKTGGAGSSRIWAQQLDPSGQTFAAGSTATTILVPDQSWEGGTVEAPDLFAANGHYYLFYSGNEWSNADYAVGVATCTGPLGPCGDVSSTPILSSGNGMAGPGGESVFPDANGGFWIAFDAWSPTAVGGSNSRGLYIRSLDLSGSPVVGGPP
jgi:glycosyl hydrolase family 43